MKWAYHVITQAFFLVVLAGSVYGIFGEESLPGSELFAVLALAVCAYVGGIVVSCVRLPPLIGMLAVGILLRNLPFATLTKDISTKSASTLRDVALAIILLKAGLGLDAEKLRRLKTVVLKLSFLPCLFEAASTALFAHFFLGMPWVWSCMLGFILSAVSAAVLVPGALRLEENRLGTVQGVPTLLMASVSLDNIAALTGFIVVFNVLTSNESITWTFCKRLVEPFAGLLIGAVGGILLWFFPHERKSDRPTVIYYRTALLCLGGLASTFVSRRFDISGVGALGCVSLAFCASLRWKHDAEMFKSITWITGVLWLLIEPFLFGLIGIEVTLESLHNHIGYGILMLLCGLSVRVLTTVVALLGSDLNLKEKLFVSISWTAKATVQAAVASQALDFGRTEGKDERFQELGRQVLTMSVLSIILTAPLGAAFMDMMGRHLLRKEVTRAPVNPNSDFPRKASVPAIKISTHYGSCPQTDAFPDERRASQSPLIRSWS